MGIRALWCALSVLVATSSFPASLSGQAPEFRSGGLVEGFLGRIAQPTPARGRGALWGAGIGAVAGGLLGGLSVESEDGDDEFGGSLGEAAVTGAAVLVGALVGAGLGALLGATVFAPSRPSASFNVGPALSVDPLVSVDGVGTVLRVRW